MNQTREQLEAAGLEVTDLSEGSVFASRQKHQRDILVQLEALNQLASAFIDRPESLLQELLDVAVRLCGADSAGISVVREDGTDRDYYRWIATAGEYSSFLNASLPQYPSACSVCLYRDAPQHFRVGKKFFDILGVEAAVVRDGILLPWRVENSRGTIFIMSHSQEEAFYTGDVQLMKLLASFAAMGIRQQRLQERLRQEAEAASAVAMANDLAHQINNPLQSLTNKLYLAKASGDHGEKALALCLEPDFERLSVVTKHLLELPRRERLLSKSSN